MSEKRDCSASRNRHPAKRTTFTSPKSEHCFSLFIPVKRAGRKSFAKVLSRHMSEHRDGSAVRVMTAPWRANFLAGFMRAAHAPFGPAKAVQRKRCRAIPGSPFLWFLSFGEAKERNACGRHTRSPRRQNRFYTKARRQGEISFINPTTSARTQKTCHIRH